MNRETFERSRVRAFERESVGQSSVALVEPDAATWDAFVDAHRHGNLLQTSGWAGLKSRFGWQGRRLAFADRNGLVAGAQILFKHRFGVSAAYVPRGPLFDADNSTNQLLIRAIETLARRNRAIFVRFEPNVLESDFHADLFHAELLQMGFEARTPLQPQSTVQLNLQPDPERLLAAMSKGHRADIRRAIRDGVRVREGSGEADLDAFYQVMQATSVRAGFGIHSREYYGEVLRIFGTAGRALLLVAEWQNAVVATAMVCADAHAGLYLYSGSTADGLKSGAQHALQWHAIQWARARGCATYDFWGIPDAFGQAAQAPDPATREALETAAKTDPLYGVYRFKKGFGGHVVRYLPAYDRVFVPPLYRLWRRRLN